MPFFKFEKPEPPTVGDSVRFLTYGGSVRLIDCGATGTVVRINRNGHPVIAFRCSHENAMREVHDRMGCARVIAS